MQLQFRQLSLALDPGLDHQASGPGVGHSDLTFLSSAQTPIGILLTKKNIVFPG